MTTISQRIAECEKGCGKHECISCYHSSLKGKKQIQHDSKCSFSIDSELVYRCGELTGFGGVDYINYCNDCKIKIDAYKEAQAEMMELKEKIKDIINEEIEDTCQYDRITGEIDKLKEQTIQEKKDE